jgi:pyrrolysine biosynthesis protein PylC
MDVEVIVDSATGRIIVLEIDARLPSQTPLAVYHATGINLLAQWVDTHLRQQPLQFENPRGGCAILEHFRAGTAGIDIIGETRLLPWDRPRQWPNGRFFGATEALTDFMPGKPEFKATVIFKAADRSGADELRRKFYRRLCAALGTDSLSDPSPPAFC